jgi:hypothetical protein
VTAVIADTPETEQTPATLIYIYGPPASGKLTVATRLSELTGIPLFHNHLTVNAVTPIFAFGSPPFTEAVQAMRRGVFKAAAKAGVSLIYTNNSAWSGPNPRARFVDSRVAHEKLVDVVRLRELLAHFDPSPLHPDDLAIDTGRTSPDESARIIAAALG